MSSDREAQVHVWRIDLDQPATVVANLGALLDAEALERAGRLRPSKLAERYVVAHAALREVLASHGAGPADALRFTRGKHGKPRLANAPLPFSVSHSASVALVAVAVAGTTAVGVDVERMRAGRDLTGIARRFFSPDEAALLEAAPEYERAVLFHRFWTVKEACVKQDGRGIGETLGSVRVRLGEAAPVALDETTGAAWRVAELEPRPGHRAAVAVQATALRVTTRDWRPAVCVPARQGMA